MMFNLPVKYDELPWEVVIEVREQYELQQGYKCYYCKQALNKTPSNIKKKYKVNYKLFPKNFFKHPVHLHHNHDTGLTIGAVHSYCNAVLWQYHRE